ncbi:hypothetical protein GIB67_007656, partial [Kingdonia uniflora]
IDTSSEKVAPINGNDHISEEVITLNESGAEYEETRSNEDVNGVAGNNVYDAYKFYHNYARGYLCRHALSILNHNGVLEIPSKYILAQWREDFKWPYAKEDRPIVIDIDNPICRYDSLYKCVIQFVDEGDVSKCSYKFALQIFEESLHKIRLLNDHVEGESPEKR